MESKNKIGSLKVKFRPLVDGEIAGEEGFEFSREERDKNATACSIITANEVLDNLKEIKELFNFPEGSYPIDVRITFWEEVKKGLEHEISRT